MGILLTDCPYCGGAKMTFTPLSQSAIASEPGRSYAFCTCAGCTKAILLYLDNPQTINLINTGGNLEGVGGLRILRSWPPPKSNTAPRFSPENVARFYSQAANAINRRDWDAAGSMSRKALDVGTRCVDTSDAFAKKKLGLRIDDLAARQLITPQMKDWAHAIRVDGNDAVHDPDVFTEEEATRLFDFADLFLQYTFKMPGMLKERSEGKIPDGTKA